MPTPPLDLSGLPREPGVYRFREAGGRVLYIGRATELRRRVRSYWGSQKGRPRMRRMVPKIGRVELVVCDSEHEAAWLERNLLEQSKPAWNRARGGLEVPIYLQIDPGPRRPSVALVHQVAGDLRHFGPYLGGTRVRVAAQALATVHPLAHAGDALTGAEQSMAEARGVQPADRDRLLEAVVGVLDRDPGLLAETRAALVDRRARAAADLEFELAGRFQDQLEALDWLVSPQRVTTDDPVDAVAAGWSDGVLVEFGIRAGRVRTWKQSACTRDRAAGLLDATPPGWADFAGRNAELAAALHASHAR